MFSRAQHITCFVMRVTSWCIRMCGCCACVRRSDTEHACGVRTLRVREAYRRWALSSVTWPFVAWRAHWVPSVRCTILPKYLRKLFHTFLSLTNPNSSLAHSLLHILFLVLNHSRSRMFHKSTYIYYLPTLSVLSFARIFFTSFIRAFYRLPVYSFTSLFW